MPRAKRNPALDKAALARDIARDQRLEEKRKREELAAAARAAAAARRAKARGAKGQCKAARAATRARFAEARKVRDEARRKKAEAKGVCAVDVTGERAREIAARVKLEEEIRFQRDMRRIERGNRARKKAERASARVVASESDDEVRGNIPADLVPLFDRVRRSIKGSARMSRTEAFLKYAEEHPSEVRSSVNDETDAEVARLVRELEEREAYANPGRALLVPDPRHGDLVVLGAWTAATVRKGKARVHWKFKLDRAPVLAFHSCSGKRCPQAGKLVVVCSPRAVRKAETGREFRRVHWGDKGKGELLSGSVYGGGAVEILGTLESVTYTTVKGGDMGAETDYVHEFGEGAPRGARVVRPVVGRGDGCYVIAGGSYRIGTRGIVG